MMKKTYAFIFVAVLALGGTVTLVSAQTASTVQNMTGVRGVALRTFCSFSTLFGANNANCFDANRVAIGNTASVGAAGIGLGDTGTVPSTGLTPAQPGAASIGGFSVATAPQVIERTVVVQGAPGPQGPAGAPGLPGNGATGAFVNVPQVFWNGGGGSGGGSVTTFVTSGFTLPIGGAPGQVLGLDASSTPIWITLPTTSSTSSTSTIIASSTPSIAWLLSGNASTSATDFLGTLDNAPLVVRTNNVERLRVTEDGGLAIGTSTLTYPHFNPKLRVFGGDILASQGTSLVFDGVASSSGIVWGDGNTAIKNESSSGIIQSVFGGLGGGDFVLKSVALDTPENRLKFVSSDAVFNHLEGARIASIFTDRATSTLSGELAFYTNENSGSVTERMRLTSKGFLGIGTSTPMRPLTVVGDVSGTLAMFQNTRAGAPAGVSMLATRADGTPATRGGLFAYGATSTDDRLGVHFVGFGDVQTWDKQGNTFLGAPVAAINAPMNAKLSVFGSDNSKPVAIFKAPALPTTAIFTIQDSTATDKVFVNKNFGFEVPFEAYGPTWNNNNEVPTKAALFTKLESLAASSTVAGVTGNVQFNNGGVFGANPNFNWDIANSRLDIGGTTGNDLLFVNGMIRVNNGGVISAHGDTLFATQGTGSTIVSADQNKFVINSNIGSNPHTAYLYSTGAPLRFGIGTTTPMWALDVVGDASIHGVRVGLGGGSVFSNTVLGKEALMANTTGARNTASGYRTLFSNTEGHNNAAFGAQALAMNTLGNSNVGVGISALFSNISGNSNVALGGGSLAKSTTGSHNVALGAQALDGLVLGSGNIGIGYQAGRNITTGQNNIIVGFQIDAQNPIGDNQLNIGNLIFSQGVNATGTALSTGNLGIGIAAPARKLHVAIAGAGQVARFQNVDGVCNINPSIFLAFNCLSDKNLKKDIVALDSSLAAFAQLNPVNYHWNTEDSAAPLQYGFIAQEIENIFPSFVSTDEETGIKSVAFGNLIPVTVKAIQEINVALGDLSKDTTADVFAQSVIYKRFTDAFKTLTVAFKDITADKATVKELCLPKSDGTVICLNGDQVAAIAANAGLDTSSSDTKGDAPVEPTPVVEEVVLIDGPGPAQFDIPEVVEEGTETPTETVSASEPVTTPTTEEVPAA